MAIEIRIIPILEDKIAKKFVEKANDAYAMKATIDFSKEIESAKKILEKAKMK